MAYPPSIPAYAGMTVRRMAATLHDEVQDSPGAISSPIAAATV